MFLGTCVFAQGLVVELLLQGFFLYCCLVFALPRCRVWLTVEDCWAAQGQLSGRAWRLFREWGSCGKEDAVAHGTNLRQLYDRGLTTLWAVWSKGRTAMQHTCAHAEHFHNCTQHKYTQAECVMTACVMAYFFFSRQIFQRLSALGCRTQLLVS